MYYIKDELKELKGKDYNKISAKEFSDLICSKLKKGFLKKEISVENRGDGRGGRVDLEYHINNKIIGIELDRITPRKKLIFKLKNNYEEAYIITRSPITIFNINDL